VITYLREVRGNAVALERYWLAQILIIDDDPGIGEILKRILESSGHEVQSVPDPLLGVDMINTQDIDLAIVDIFMPQKSGLEIIQEVTRSKPGVKLLAMTAFGGQDDIDMRGFAERYGAVGTFEKPFNNAEVVAKVAKALSP
jgi:DNA-binding response OmpR family regulator